MGYIRHDAIVVTSWDGKAIKMAAQTARDFGLHVLGPSGEHVNGYRTLLVCPDGSKEGWDESDAGDAKRAKFMDYLNSVRYVDGGSQLEWVAIAYRNDDATAEFIAHTWDTRAARSAA